MTSSSSDNNNNKRGDPAEIPKEDVSGEVNVESYSKTASLGQISKDLDFPASKDKIVQFIQQKNPTNEGDLLSSLQNIEDRQYHNVSDVTKAAGLVY
jgi:uncharacterized protein DUF2795